MLPITLEILICFVLSILLLNRYCDMINSNLVTVVGVFISWFFSFMVIFLLPADLTSTSYRQCILDHTSNSSAPNVTQSPTLVATTMPGNASGIQIAPPSNSTCDQPNNLVSDVVLMKLWRFIYWSSQFLTWLVLPIMQSYSKEGDFTTSAKLKSAIRSNLIYYSSLGAIFTVLLVYVIIEQGLDFANLKVIAISASNTWGLFLLVVLLGYGLVELPRFLINRSRYAQSLNYQYFRVAKVNAEKCEAEEILDDVLEEIHRASLVLGANELSPMRGYLNKIINKCPPDWKKRSSAFRRQVAASNVNYEDTTTGNNTYDIQRLTALHKKVIKAVQRHRQVNCKWSHIIREVIDWEDVVKNQTENKSPYSRRAFLPTLPRERTIISPIYTPTVEWYWKCVTRIWIYRISGVMMAILSAAVVWSEIAFPISLFSTKLSIFGYFIDSFQSAQSYVYLEIFSIMSIGYLATCAFYTVFHMKIFNIYYLAPNSQTDEYSLIFSGMLLCRLTAPLCLNFLCLVNRDSHIVKQSSTLETSFTRIMGHLDLIPIVNNGLNVFLPFCISAICSAIYFNFGSRILHNFGYEQFIEDDGATIELIQTGHDLVKRETTKLLRHMESTTTTSYQQMTGASADFEASQVGPSSRPPGAWSNLQDVSLGMEAGSPTSETSSSSGFSRSSLLPKSGGGGGGSGRPAGGNVMQVNLGDTKEAARGGESQSGGFFDDV